MIMKKLFTILAAMVAVFSFVSCNKEIPAVEEQQQDAIKLNIKVADLASKAVKSGWTSGDKINIWYDKNITRNPDLVIEYDGSDWSVDQSATVSGAKPSANGTLNAVYVQNGVSVFSKYSDISSVFGYPAAQFSTPSTGVKVDTQSLYTATPLTSFVESAAYTFESETLSVNLEAWTFKKLNNVQVVISNLPEGTWVLKCNRLMLRNTFVLSDGGFGTSSQSYDEYALSTDNADGKAFMYYYESSDTDFLFTLHELSSNVTMTYSVTGKTLDKSGKLNAIKIDYSKFEDIYPSYVLDGDAAIYAFTGKSVAEKEIVRDITCKNCSIYPVREIKNRVKRIEGTLTIDNCSSTYIAMFEVEDSERSICIKNCTATGSNPAFCGEIKNKIVEGNLIFQNCPNMNMFNDDGAGPCAIKEVKGDYVMDACININGNAFKNLTRVGGDFVLTNNVRFWDLRQKTIPLTEIGGNLVVKGNSDLDSTIGFEHLTKIGGNVTFFGPYIPNQDADANIKGFKIFKTYLDSGVISPGATILIGRNEASPIDVNSL